VNSNTENQKTFEGSSRAHKGKITAKDENWRDQKEQGSLTSYCSVWKLEVLVKKRNSERQTRGRSKGGRKAGSSSKESLRARKYMIRHEEQAN